ncbi:MAG: glycoside hydrolase family 127 protein [Kiritimatiellae bacterium]|nr:glycoside hydrolase family 127 protein [Kiritimatiellia bacterium]
MAKSTKSLNSDIGRGAPHAGVWGLAPALAAICRRLRPGEITARGWLRSQLELSLQGMGGHLGEIEPDQMEKPYVTRDFDPAKGARGVVGWCAEMGGEFAQAQAALAYALGDAALIKKTAARVRAAMALQEPDGYLGAYRPGDDRNEDYNAWGSHIFYEAMLLEYARTGDAAILDAVHRALLWFVENWSGDCKTDYAGPTIIRTMSDVYRLTDDARLLRFAEEYAAWLDVPGRKHGATFTTFPLGKHEYHVAALAVRLELPIALAVAAKRQELFDAAMRTISDWRDGLGWQASYAPCADGEWTSAPSCVGETEYCDYVFSLDLFQRLAAVTGDPAWADAIERIVFNAAQGARAKDERTIGYMTSPNQWYATRRSSRHGPEPYYQVYAPNVNAACCPANSIRLWPQYVLGAVMREGDDLRISNYGPMAVRTQINGATVALDLETDYPFDGRVAIRVRANGWRGALRLRRPAWASGVTVTRNGEIVAVISNRDDAIITISGPWGAEETIEVAFAWKPVVKAVRDRDFSADTPLKVVEWGALVFSQPVEEHWTPVPRPAPTWGEDHSPPQPAEWPWFDVEPVREPEPLALPNDLNPAAIRVERAADGNPLHPWQKPPVRLVVPMVRAEAAYPPESRGGPHTPVPAAGVVAPDPGAKPQDVALVPFGATTIRTTCFPTAK